MHRVLYDQHGNTYRPADIPLGDRLVWSRVIDEDGEESDGDLLSLPEAGLSDRPLRRKVDDDIARAREALADLREQIRTEEARLAEADASGKRRLDRLKEHRALVRIEEFLDGKITHFVEWIGEWRPPVIVAASEATTADGGHHRSALKLLTLFGKTGGDLEWRLNRYSDGSGSNNTVYPCRSLEEAQQKAAEIFAEHTASAMEPETNTKPSERWLAGADACGTALGAEYAAAAHRAEEAVREAKIVKLQAEITTLQTHVG